MRLGWWIGGFSDVDLGDQKGLDAHGGERTLKQESGF